MLIESHWRTCINLVTASQFKVYPYLEPKLLTWSPLFRIPSGKKGCLKSEVLPRIYWSNYKSTKFLHKFSKKFQFSSKYPKNTPNSQVLDNGTHIHFLYTCTLMLWTDLTSTSPVGPEHSSLLLHKGSFVNWYLLSVSASTLQKIFCKWPWHSLESDDVGWAVLHWEVHLPEGFQHSAALLLSKSEHNMLGATREEHQHISAEELFHRGEIRQAKPFGKIQLQPVLLSWQCCFSCFPRETSSKHYSTAYTKQNTPHTIPMTSSPGRGGKQNL